MIFVVRTFLRNKNNLLWKNKKKINTLRFYNPLISILIFLRIASCPLCTYHYVSPNPSIAEIGEYEGILRNRKCTQE